MTYGRFPGSVWLLTNEKRSREGYEGLVAARVDPTLGLDIPRLEPAPSTALYSHGQGPHLHLPVVGPAVLSRMFGRMKERAKTAALVNIEGESLGDIFLLSGLHLKEMPSGHQRVTSLQIRMNLEEDRLVLTVSGSLGPSQEGWYTGASIYQAFEMFNATISIPVDECKYALFGARRPEERSVE